VRIGAWAGVQLGFRVGTGALLGTGARLATGPAATRTV
jgi:hypothetical protein